MAAESFFRLRRASTAQSAFPTLLPGELAINTYSAALVVGDAATAQKGQPIRVNPVGVYRTGCTYMANSLVAVNGQIFRCRRDGAGGSFLPADWEQITGVAFNQGVFNPTPILTGAYSPLPNDWCRVNTTATEVNLTPQATPADGVSFRVSDVAGNFVNNVCRILNNGQLINGVNTPYEMQTIPDAVFLFSTGFGWRVLP